MAAALCVASRRIHFHPKGPSSKPVSRRLCHSPLDQEKRTHRTRREFLSLRSTPVFTQWNHFSNQAHTQLARRLFCSQNWAVCSYLYQRFFKNNMIHSRFDFFCFAFSKNRCMSTLPLGLAPGKERWPSPRSVSSRKTHATESLRSPLVRDSLPGTSLGTRPSNLWHWVQFFQSSHCLPSGRDSRTLQFGSEACSSPWEIHALINFSHWTKVLS